MTGNRKSDGTPARARPKSSGELMRWLWSTYLRRHIGLLGLAMVFMVIEGGMVGAVSYMMQPMFDMVFVQGNAGALGWVSVAFLVIFSLRGIAGMLQKVLLTQITQDTAAHLRMDLLARLIRQDTAFHQTHPPGFLIQRVQSDVGAVNDVWRAIITGAGARSDLAGVPSGGRDQCRLALDGGDADRRAAGLPADRGGAALRAQEGLASPAISARCCPPGSTRCFTASCRSS